MNEENQDSASAGRADGDGSVAGASTFAGQAPLPAPAPAATGPSSGVPTLPPLSLLLENPTASKKLGSIMVTDENAPTNLVLPMKTCVVPPRAPSYVAGGTETEVDDLPDVDDRAEDVASLENVDDPLDSDANENEPAKKRARSEGPDTAVACTAPLQDLWGTRQFGWSCGVCCLRNGDEQTKCTSCGARKGSWTCNHCLQDDVKKTMAMNEAEAVQCKNCQNTRGTKPDRSAVASAPLSSFPAPSSSTFDAGSKIKFGDPSAVPSPSTNSGYFVFKAPTSTASSGKSGTLPAASFVSRAPAATGSQLGQSTTKFSFGAPKAIGKQSEPPVQTFNSDATKSASSSTGSLGFTFGASAPLPQEGSTDKHSASSTALPPGTCDRD